MAAVVGIRNSRLKAVRKSNPSVSSGQDAQLPGRPAVSGAVLLKKICAAHGASLTSALVLSDTEGHKAFVSSSLDKTIATWTLQPSGALSQQDMLTCRRVTIDGSPVFSTTPMPERKDEAPDVSGTQQGIFCGMAAKKVVPWYPTAAEGERQSQAMGVGMLHYVGDLGWFC